MFGNRAAALAEAANQLNGKTIDAGDVGIEFTAFPNVSYSDTDCSFEGIFFEQPLFSINNSEDVMDKLVKKMLKFYRQ